MVVATLMCIRNCDFGRTEVARLDTGCGEEIKGKNKLFLWVNILALGVSEELDPVRSELRFQAKCKPASNGILSLTERACTSSPSSLV
jgi:hypothetical protein